MRRLEPGHTNAVQLLIAHGANVNSSAALENAASERHINVLDYLPALGSDISAHGGNALQAAARYGHSESVE